MSFESLMTKCQTLKSSIEALAAIGAELRLRREKLSGDPRVRPLLQEVVHHIDPELLDDLNANQEQAALAGRLAHIRVQSTPAQCAGQSTHEFADRTRGWSSMDDKGGGGTARRVRLRAGRGILTLAFPYVGAWSAANPTQAFGVKPLGSGRGLNHRRMAA
jgi:hypothetical protein